jgi:hypothetical protein
MLHTIFEAGYWVVVQIGRPFRRGWIKASRKSSETLQQSPHEVFWIAGHFLDSDMHRKTSLHVVDVHGYINVPGVLDDGAPEATYPRGRYPRPWPHQPRLHLQLRGMRLLGCSNCRVTIGKLQYHAQRTHRTRSVITHFISLHHHQNNPFHSRAYKCRKHGIEADSGISIAATSEPPDLTISLVELRI